MARYRNLGQALSSLVPATTAAILDLGGASPRIVSYAELDVLSAAVARGLVRQGISRGEVVAVMAANRSEFLAAIFGALRAGIIAVPINHKLPKSLIAFILKDCEAKLVFCDGGRRELVPSELPCVLFDGDGRDSFKAFLDAGPQEPVDPRPGEPGLYVYTSGSTGRPKGVVFSHLGHLWALDMRSRASVPAGQRMLVAAPLYHQNGLSWCQVTFASGGTVVLLPGFTPASFIDAIDRHKVNVITGIPTMLAMMAREREHLARADLSSVVSVRIGSAPSTEALMAQAQRLFPNAALSNGFGTTEGGPVCFGPHPQGLKQPVLSVGHPHPDVEVRLMRDGEIVDDEGVLQIRSPAVMLGYHNMPELTRRVITDDGFYVTGDIFRRDAEGFFHFVGRADDMFVCGGENVFPGEVEAMLTRHPHIHQACVLPVADELKGHKPVAFIVARDGSALSEQEIKDFALANGPPYMHPRRVWFLPELPLAGTNKVDRAKLAELASRAL